MSKLIIVESPAKAKTIKKYLGSGYEVVASKGHVRNLPDRTLSVDIKNRYEPKYQIIPEKETLVKQLRDKAEKSEAVYLATDPDREVEGISWHLATVLGLDLSKPNRVTFNEITKSGIKTGMANPRKVDMDLVNAQQARRILDRLVGYTLSPFVSQKIKPRLSAGRVQSVALRLIVDREEEISRFIPEEYWSIEAKLATGSKKQFKATLDSDENGKVRLTNESEAKTYVARLENSDFEVKSVKKGTKKQKSAPPFTTSTLQQEASKKLGFQASRTMRAAQELYEGVEISGQGSTGLITYMRTDSLRISEEARAAGTEFIRQNFGDEYVPEKQNYYKSGANAQDGHEAIRPSTPSITPESIQNDLTPDQYKLYTLIWRRFIACLMAPCVMNTVKVDIISSKKEEPGRFCLLTASGSTVRFDGFTKVYDLPEEALTKNALPEIKQDEILKLKEIVSDQHFTQPPARYTEASLIKELEENGVGRPSTYASIISTITGKDYVQRKQKQLVPTELGTAVTNLLKERFPKIVNTKFTAQMESNLDEVGSGKTDYIAMLDEFYPELKSEVEKARADMRGQRIQLSDEITDEVCEICGKPMTVRNGRYGRFLGCSGYPACKNIKPFVAGKGLCPKCGGDLIEKKSAKGHTFYGCANYPECKFACWDAPNGETCPKCGKAMLEPKNGKPYCSNEDCENHKHTVRKKSYGKKKS
ncbi:MAG: type I DNA topoisomerase [Clostridia bacterium]|nr:type I DNA topoisomerase [Clostridia bacterium]